MMTDGDPKRFGRQVNDLVDRTVHGELVNSVVRLPVAPKTLQPRKPQFARPTHEDVELYSESLARREQFIQDDPVVRSTKTDDGLTTLKAIRDEVAREAAALLIQRVTNEQMGKDISVVSSKRIDALKRIADIEAEIRKASLRNKLDVRGEDMAKVLGFWIKMFGDIAFELLEENQADAFMSRLTSAMEGWEDKVEGLIE